MTALAGFNAGFLFAIEWRGVATVVLIVIVAGAIAYIGDRVGHLVGRRRMTLFGLRPRYTSTIFAIAFGMLIALLVVGVVTLFSYDARQALFSINKLNSQVASLTRERDRLNDMMKEDPVVFRFREPLSQALIVRSTDDEQTIEKQLELVFVNVARQYASIPDVRPYPQKPLTATARAKLRELAKLIRSFRPSSAVVTPVAGENIFRGGSMNISLEVFQDKLLYRRGEIIASVEVRAGASRDEDRLSLFQLLYLVVASATSHGMPPQLADNATTSADALDRALTELTGAPGPAVVKAVATNDIYTQGPLTTMLVVSVSSRR
ncbi:MAG: DUF3084 domain-containing protein [Candidatus Eremiobacteraeota bacterium]|nr:DUF3084 domain-containing protein [Candidatus Eremiobacteraeota bacterium]